MDEATFVFVRNTEADLAMRRDSELLNALRQPIGMPAISYDWEEYDMGRSATALSESYKPSAPSHRSFRFVPVSDGAYQVSEIPFYYEGKKQNRLSLFDVKSENTSVEVEFPDGLKTNYGKQLEFSQEMQGTAEIITEDVRLLERFFNPIKSLLKK